MKKEFKRYYLVEYYGNTRTAWVDSKEDVAHLLNEVKKYNNRKSSKFLMGNIEVKELGQGRYYLTAHLYRKYTEKSTISEIDSITSRLSESDVMELYKDKSKMINGALPDINIAYMETKDKDINGEVKYERGIKYLPVLYKEDVKFMDPLYIRQCLHYHCAIKDFAFFRDLANEFSVHHFITDEVSNLFTMIDLCENQFHNLRDLYYAADDLYSKFILEYERDESLSRDKKGEYIVSRRRLRDFGFFVKNYNIRNSKIKSPLIYNNPVPQPEYIEEEDGQYKLILK